MNLLDKMATYVRVVEAGSLSAAARHLRMSASAVTRQIAKIEAELKVELLARSTRRMTVTAAGRAYYERCVRVLREVEAAQSVGARSRSAGLLTVSVPITFGLEKVVPHLPALMSRNPGLRIDLQMEDRLIDLVMDGVDVAIRVGSAPDSAEVIAHRLGEFRRVLVASPAYLRRRGEPGSPEALARHDGLTHSKQLPGGMFLRRGREEARLQLEPVFRSSALHAVRAAAVAGLGIALLPDFLVEGELAAKRLKRVLRDWETDPAPVYALVRRSQRASPPGRLLIDHLREVYGAASA